MRVFVGAEYVIANALIALRKKGKTSKTTLPSLRNFGIDVQRYCLEKNIDALFLLSADRMSNAVYNFPDYFSLETIDGMDYIDINQDAPVTMLEERFIGYLPWGIIEVLLEKSEAFAG